MTDESDVNTRSFARIPTKLLMKRVSLPLCIVLVLGVIASGQFFKYTTTKTGREIASVETRSPAALLYSKVFDDWTNIPSVCKEDFPLTEFQKTQCDSFWRSVLTRGMLAGFPFLIAFILFQSWAHAVKRTYQRAASRVARRKVNAIGEVVGEAKSDTYSWSHGLRPFQVKSGDLVMVAYLEKHAECGQGVHLYEAGRWFGRKKLVAVKAA
jgi:hypothetical protein